VFQKQFESLFLFFNVFDNTAHAQERQSSCACHVLITQIKMIVLHNMEFKKSYYEYYLNQNGEREKSQSRLKETFVTKPTCCIQLSKVQHSKAANLAKGI